MTQSELDAVPVAAGWDDGRHGFMWPRLDAVIETRGNERLCAELTWFGGGEAAALCERPELWLERSVWPNGFHGDYEVIDGGSFDLTNEQAVRMAASPPSALLDEYTTEIAALWATTSKESSPCSSNTAGG